MKYLIIILITLVIHTINAAPTQPKDVDNKEEEILDVALDLYFIGSSAMHIITYGSGWGALALDVGCLFIPGATGVGTLSRKSYMLTKGARAAARAENITKATVNKLMQRQAGKSIRMSKKQVDNLLTHSVKSHGFYSPKVFNRSGNKGAFNRGLCDNSSQARALLNEMLAKAAGGKFMMKSACSPHNKVMLSIDMGKHIGSDKFGSCHAINIIISGGYATMYPVKNTIIGIAKTLH